MGLEFITKSAANKATSGFTAPVVKVNPNNGNINLSKLVIAKLNETLPEGTDALRIGFAVDAETKYVGIYLSAEGLKPSKSGHVSHAAMTARIQEVLELDLAGKVGQFTIDLEKPTENEIVGNIYALTFDTTLEPRKVKSKVVAEEVQYGAVVEAPQAVMAVVPTEAEVQEMEDTMPTEGTQAEEEGSRPTELESLTTEEEPEGDVWP
jgi:hypothetical protein